MNVAGTLSTIIFVITVLTVVAALLSYLIFKSRERSRKGKAPAGSQGVVLQYFTEFSLPGMQQEAIRRGSTMVTAKPAESKFGLYALAFAVLLLLTGGGVFGLYRYFWRDTGAAKAAASPSAASNKPPAKISGHGPTVVASRPKPPDITALPRRAASLFLRQEFDKNGDKKIQRAERAAIHRGVPQFVVLTSDDNGSVQGLKWLHTELERRKLLRDVTFFLTANYLEGRKNYLGGQVSKWWQRTLERALVGMHGTTHAPGADTWTFDRWYQEHATVQSQIIARLRLPGGWSWAEYPWGTRAPFLMLTDRYFQALVRAPKAVRFDSSLIVRPGGTKMVAVGPDEVRDVSWPFSLTQTLPPDVDLPYLPAKKKRATIEQHNLWEFPVYGWYLHPPGQKPLWQPSMDYNVWKLFGCKDAQGNQKIVGDVLANFKAHYRGNRAPFHLGVHAGNYDDKDLCHRATLVLILDAIDAIKRDKGDVRYTSIPKLLAWIGKQSKPKK